MKRVIFFAAFIIFFFLGGCGNQGETKAELVTLDGESIAFEALKGQWVIINYWASWCAPCMQEIPQLNAFYHSHKGHGVKIYGVNFDQFESSELKRTIAKMGIQFPNLSRDPAHQLGLGEIPGIPMTFVFNPQGKLTQKLFGEQTIESLEKAIAKDYPATS